MQHSTTDNDLFLQLLDKYLLESITAEDTKLLFSLLENPANQEIFKAQVGLALEEGAFLELSGTGMPEHIKKQLNARIAADERSLRPDGPVHFLHRRFIRYAAAILLVAGIATMVVVLLPGNKKTELVHKNETPVDVGPGSERAVLTLADGSAIALDSAVNGTIAQQGNTEVVKLSNGKIAYRLKGPSQEEVLINRISTPRGGQYQLLLPDGTKVWLNAASSITYPTMFVDRNRKVKVSGEAYFEVAKQRAHPFIVDVDGQMTVEVLGTHFNINAYNDEPRIRTTLIEGSVRVMLQEKHQQSVILTPGKQASAATRDPEGSQLQTQTTDIETVIAWKNGYFQFKGNDLPSLMRQVARWYDVDIVYEGATPQRSFSGQMQRTSYLSGIVKILEASDIHCSLKGNKLVVSP